jgi:ribonuclease HII
MRRFLAGIDEAGRGPLAGPVSVGVVAVPDNFDFKLFDGVRDSKLMTEAAREEWFERLPQLAASAGVRWSVQFSSAQYIDAYGIVPAVRRALAHALRELALDPGETEVRLDGSLKAPAEFLHQTTIIRGDQTEPVISMASVAAKVSRDRLMKKLASKYPEYGFDIHKGYGTKKHAEAIAKFGLCSLHRTTFCKVEKEGKRSTVYSRTTRSTRA